MTEDRKVTVVLRLSPEELQKLMDLQADFGDSTVQDTLRRIVEKIHSEVYTKEVVQ